jgi:hypothetical protein
MSDADDQMGGTGGGTGLDPSKAEPGKDNEAPAGGRSKKADAEDAEADEAGRESFPASDSPAY